MNLIVSILVNFEHKPPNQSDFSFIINHCYSQVGLYNCYIFIIDKAAVRSDAAAELDRLTRAQKKVSSSGAGSGVSSANNNSIEGMNNSSEC